MGNDASKRNIKSFKQQPCDHPRRIDGICPYCGDGDEVTDEGARVTDPKETVWVYGEADYVIGVFVTKEATEKYHAARDLPWGYAWVNRFDVQGGEDDHA